MKDNPLLYRFFRPVVTFFIKVLFRPIIINKDNIPEEGAIVICGNHTKWLDPLLLVATTKKTIHFMSKDELYKGLKKIIFKSLGTIPVNRRIKDKEALNKAIECLNNNFTIGLFPEGTINRTKDSIMPFKFGAVSMASKTNAYLVPFAITGKYKIFKRNVQIEFLKAYKVQDNDLEKENNLLMEKVKNIIIRENRNGKE